MRSHATALASFEKELRRLNRSPVTVKILLGTARKFLRFVAARISSIETKDVREYLASRSGHVAVTTTWAELWHLRVFFRVLVDAKLCPSNPTDGVTTKAGEHPPQLLLGESSIRELLASSVNHRGRKGRFGEVIALRDRAVLELLYGVGLRASEVCAARVTDLSVADMSVFVRRAKRGENRRLPLPPTSIAALARYLSEARPRLTRSGQDGGALVVTYAGRPIQRGDVWSLVSKAAKRAGFRAYPHALRRALATHLVRSGVSVRAVQLLLGHQSLETTQRYVGVDRNDLRAAVLLLDQQQAREKEIEARRTSSAATR